MHNIPINRLYCLFLGSSLCHNATLLPTEEKGRREERCVTNGCPCEARFGCLLFLWFSTFCFCNKYSVHWFQCQIKSHVREAIAMKQVSGVISDPTVACARLSDSIVRAY